MARLIVRAETRGGPGERHQPVERAAIEQVPTDLPRDRATDGALARAAWAVDRDDGTGRGLRHRESVPQSLVTPKPAWRAHSSNPGKLVATLATSRISTGARARSAATAKAMAMR